ncbi:MAG: 6-bladed beta-propeller [Rikenellaceae bacterium]
MSKVNLFIVALSLLIVYSCGNKGANGSKNIVDISNSTKIELKMSDYFSSVRYLPLETTDESLIGGNAEIAYCDNDIIVITSASGCHVFNSQSGKFLRKVGTKGKGHDEYLAVAPGKIVDGEKMSIVMSRGLDLIEYSLLDGSVINSTIPQNIHDSYFGYIIALGDGTWARGEYNIRGKMANRLYFFDKNRILDSLPNHLNFEPNTKGRISVNKREVMAYHFNKETFYKYMYCDTIFNISNRSYKPKWIIKLESSTEDLAKLLCDDDFYTRSLEFHTIQSVVESDNYLFFESSRYEKTKPIIYSKESGEATELKFGGFIDDIEGGLPFFPRILTSNKKVSSLINCETILGAFEKERGGENSSEIKTSDSFKANFSKLTLDSNPVVAIASF